MLKRKPISPNINRSDYNNGGLHEYDPYIIKSDNGSIDVIIDKKWWESLSPFIQKLIRERLSDFEIDDIGVPPIPPIPPIPPESNESDTSCDPKGMEKLKILDQSYLDGFDYHIWYNNKMKNGPQNVQMIYISPEIKDILLYLHENYNDKSIQSWLDKLTTFKNQINDIMVPDQKYFMRLSSTSGKNYQDVRPMCTTEDILSNLIKNKIFVKREYGRKNKDTYLILIPWNDDMDERYEFRIFVKDGKLVAASQQWWSTLFNYTQEEIDIIDKAINNISFLKDIIYQDYIGDVYIDINEKVCKLVEINPYGAHCGAGSSLFNWITDYDILYNKVNDPQLRYLSVINY